MSRVVTIYGSSRTLPESPDYVEALEVGRVLARAGFAVMNGGYGGTMAAVSQGAAEVGGSVIGVTCQQIEDAGRSRPNAWLTERVHYDLLRDRILHMIERADAYLALPGGIGTLHEIAETWETLRVAAVTPRPLIAYGAHWEAILGRLKASVYVSEDYRRLMRFARSPQDVIAILNEWDRP